MSAQEQTLWKTKQPNNEKSKETKRTYTTLSYKNYSTVQDYISYQAVSFDSRTPTS